MSRLDLFLHGCQEEHVPTYIDSPARQERLDRLRDSAMVDWESALSFGDGNYLTSVYAPMLLGLIDIARLSERLLEHPGDEQVRADMRARIKYYLRDLDTAKAAQRFEQARDKRASTLRRQQAMAKADAAAMAKEAQ